MLLEYTLEDQHPTMFACYLFLLLIKIEITGHAGHIGKIILKFAFRALDFGYVSVL